MLEEDWIMRQINDMVQFLAGTILRKSTTRYEPGQVETAGDRLHARLTDLLDEGRVDEADRLLRAQADPHDPRYLELVVDFYDRLNHMSDTALEAAGYERDTAEEGLRQAARDSGIPFL